MIEGPLHKRNKFPRVSVEKSPFQNVVYILHRIQISQCSRICETSENVDPTRKGSSAVPLRKRIALRQCPRLLLSTVDRLAGECCESQVIAFFLP